MKKLLVIKLFLYFTPIYSFAQWGQYCGFPITPPMFATGGFIDAEFLTPDSGVYMQSYYYSPSSGGGFSVSYSIDSALNWTQTFGGGGLGAGGAQIITQKRRSTYYALHTDQGVTKMAKSNDGGLNWLDYGTIGAWSCKMFPCDTNKFYAIHNYSSGNLTKYENGVFNYNQATFPGKNLTGLFFPDTAIGYISAIEYPANKSHVILKTINGGVNWAAVLNDSLINIRGLFFTNNDIGFAIGDSGKIIKTIDGGVNWLFLNSAITVNLNSLFFVSDSLGFAAGDSGIIIRTYDGGMTWSKDFVNTTNTFTKINFVNDSIGFALAKNITGSSGTLYFTNIHSLTSTWHPQIQKHLTLLVTPNPTLNQCDVIVPDDFIHEKNLTLSIYDNTGKLMQQKTLEMNDGKIKVNLEQEAKGIYNVTLANKKKSYNGMIVFE